MTIVGELYTIEERAKTQAVFSSVWGLASIAGPLVGGYITDALSWRWVFFINIPFGGLALAVIALAYPAARTTERVQVDWWGAALLFSGVSTLLIALGDIAGSPALWVVATVVLLGAFVMVERGAPEPILPVELLRTPVVSRTLAVVFLVGFALFGAISFIPLYVQGVLGGSATEAGQVLTPLFLGWVAMSVVGARTAVRLGYRVCAVSGSLLMTLGFAGTMLLDATSPRMFVLASCLVLGAGMGTQMLSLLLAVQHGVDRSRLGLATSLNQFSRSIGAAVGVAAMGAVLARGLSGVALPTGGSEAIAAGVGALSGPARLQLAAALHRVFLMGTVVSTAGLVATFFLPPVDLSSRVRTTAARPSTATPEARAPIALPE
jgi:MFS family permease